VLWRAGDCLPLQSRARDAARVANHLGQRAGVSAVTYRVGKTYRILAMLIGGPPVPIEGGETVTVPDYEGFTGWLPLLNDFSQDDDFIHERRYHAHIDYRFLPDHWFRHFERTQWRKTVSGRHHVPRRIPAGRSPRIQADGVPPHVRVAGLQPRVLDTAA
jgi:hypothetical protein